MPGTPTFALSKWYLDCVDADGRAAILYWANLRVRGLAFGFASTLVREPAGPVAERSTLRAGEAPAESGHTVSWSCDALGVSGRWRGVDPPVEATLLEGDEGAIVWSCRQPRSRAVVSLPGGHSIDGWGYAEHLSVTIAPWRLPIDELRWGRFGSASDSVVWIEWRGAEPRCLVFHDSRPVAAPRIAADGIAWGPGGVVRGQAALAFEQTHVLRDGPLLATVLPAVPGLQRLGARLAPDLHETKWLSAASLRVAGSGVASGWAIHERVRFRTPRPPSWPPER